ncbi:Fic family protein [Haloglomus litoreum]|uniref:Fic family protein n=1 Tax=Haloglomus litoreum TaxID=3034026 RepID=UPI0023E8D619|nr:Fic family protein [Haloglomus sp. DT116]
MKDGYDLADSAPGQYMPLREDKQLSKAYFPDRLPPSLTLSDDVVEAYGDAMWALGRLDGLGSEVSNPGAVFGSFVYKEAEQSSQVEGTAVTLSDIYRFEVEGAQLGEGQPTDEYEADVREARNYIRALDEAVDYLTTAGRSRENLTAELIKQLHATLLSGGRTDEPDPLPGAYRPDFAVIQESNPNALGTRIRFVPPKAEMVPRLMDNLEEYLQSGSRWPPLIDIAVAHYQFETIHPFKDGNGRVGRLLVVLMLLAMDLLHYPMLYLSSYIERHRDEYADRLLAVSEQGDWEAWLQFFLRGIREQATEAFVRAKLLLQLRHEYDQQYAAAPKSVQRLMAALFEEPYFSVTEAADMIEMTYQSANNAVGELEADGVIREITGNQQNRVFRAEEVMEIVERPAEALPADDDLVDVEAAWTLPER